MHPHQLPFENPEENPTKRVPLLPCFLCVTKCREISSSKPRKRNNSQPNNTEANQRDGRITWDSRPVFAVSGFRHPPFAGPLLRKSSRPEWPHAGRRMRGHRAASTTCDPEPQISFRADQRRELKKGHLLAVAVLLDKNQMWKHEQLAIQKSNSSSFSDLMESDEMMAALWTHKESSLFMPSSWKSTDRRPPHDADEWLSLARANCLICEDSPAAGMTMSIYVHATMTNQMREFGYSGKFFRPPAVIRIRYSPQDFPKLDRTWSPMHFAIRESPTGDGPESRGRQ